MKTEEAVDEFFIGYAPPMPPRLSRFVVRLVLALACALLGWAVVLATGHVPLEGGVFEFGHATSVSGTIVERPFPALRPDDAAGTPWPLLVAPGKYGADMLVRGLDGRHVTLTGTRIHRGSRSMIEIEPASLASTPAGSSSTAAATPEPVAEDRVDLVGEMVDSKCFLGVMVPGSGKTHKDCASLCLRGGIPPALHVQDRSGHSSLLLVTGPKGESIAAHAAAVAGETIAVAGSVARQGGWLIVRTDPDMWRPVAR